MTARLTSASIVILASSHNPGIVSPYWLREKELITEEAKQFVNTSEFSVFESETFVLLVDSQRLQITAKKEDRAVLESLQHVGVRYVAEQAHIPYRSLGLNFDWLVEAAMGEALPQIDVNIGDTGNLSSVLSDHQLSHGFIIHAEKEPYRLRLMVEPRDSDALLYSFNYHHRLGGLRTEQVSQYIETLLSLWEHSQMIVESTSTTGEHTGD